VAGCLGPVETRDENSDLGGTMRLGGQLCKLGDGTLARLIYGRAEIVERHRHRYEVNNTCSEKLEESGLVVSGRAPDHRALCEMSSCRPLARTPIRGSSAASFTRNSPRRRVRGTPLFTSFVLAAAAYQAQVMKLCGFEAGSTSRCS
jgi:CTP synthase